MNRNDLISATVNMWGYDPKVSNTVIKGIYDTTTTKHGGYLVDITVHPELEKYGEKTNISNIRAFEEDYEALKVLWVHPELVKNLDNVKEWLTADNVTRYEQNKDFLKDFPECSLYVNGLTNLEYGQGDDVCSIYCNIISNDKTKKIIDKCKKIEGEKNYSASAFDILTVKDNYKDSTLRYITNYQGPIDLDYTFSVDELNKIKEICSELNKQLKQDEEEIL